MKLNRLILFTIAMSMCNVIYPEIKSYSGKADDEYRAERKKKNTESEKRNKGNGGKKLRLMSEELYHGNIILGSPTDNSIDISIITPVNVEIIVEYSEKKGVYNLRSESILSKSSPSTVRLHNLKENTRYYYRVLYGKQKTDEHSFNTKRNVYENFSFSVQGDSHPERPGKMFNEELYRINMRNALTHSPDLYFTLGDDFSISKLIDENMKINKTDVDDVYKYQREFLGMIGCNTSVFLVNGNHEQAANYLLDGTPDSPAVLAANARKKYYPLPSPDGFYSGNTTQRENIGYLHDYYSFEWGNSLFVVIDPYWHSKIAVDNVAGGGEKRQNMWDITIGNEQYEWLKETLKNSNAKYKFVFTHHVSGTGRGGIECAGFYEWGGKSKHGGNEFKKYRPNWEMPIHELFVKYGVTIFFQGHDHLFCRQELDDIIYQSVPNPADNTYSAFNGDRYKGVVLSNSGHLNVKVTSDGVTVDYISAVLPKDETENRKNNKTVYTYNIK